MDYKKYWNIGDSYYVSGDYNLAIKYLQKAYEIESKSECLNYIGCCYIKLNQLDKAFTIFERLTKLESWERPWFNLGRIHLYKNELEDALKCFNRAIEISPSNGNCYFYLALYHEKTNNIEEAIKLYKKSLSL